MKKQKKFPIIEDDGWVHFVFRGQVEDIALAIGFEEDIPLFHIQGTDLHFYSKIMDLAGHWEYNFASYEESQVDPLNPLIIGKDPRIRNELRMPKWSVPDFTGEPSGPRGRLEKLKLSSTHLNTEISVPVYLPAGYEESDTRYRVLFVAKSVEKRVCKICLQLMPKLRYNASFGSL